MRLRACARVATAGALLLVGCRDAPVETRAAPSSEAAPIEWVRVQHPDHDLSIELPEDTYVHQANAFSLGRPRWRDHERMQVTLFGIRRIPGSRVAYHALQLAIFWIDREALGTDDPGLERLRHSIRDPGEVESFLRSVFYADYAVEIEDLGADRVDWRPARRLSVVWTAAAGTRNERSIRGEAVVIPVAGPAALVVIGRFDAEATAREREELFPRIVHSVEIGDEESIQARGDPPPARAARALSIIESTSHATGRRTASQSRVASST